MYLLLSYLTTDIKLRWATLRARPEEGSTTESVVGLALIVVMAITVIGIIVAKVIAKANSIDLGK